MATASQQRVKRGAAHLDEKVENWWERVEPETPYDLMPKILFGSTEKALQGLFPLSWRDGGITRAMTRMPEFGFVDSSEFGNHDKSIQLAWKNEIEARRTWISG